MTQLTIEPGNGYDGGELLTDQSVSTIDPMPAPKKPAKKPAKTVKETPVEESAGESSSPRKTAKPVQGGRINVNCVDCKRPVTLQVADPEEHDEKSRQEMFLARGAHYKPAYCTFCWKRLPERKRRQILAA